MKDENVVRKRWSEDETVLALYLYFQLSFGQLHADNPEIQRLASTLGRSSNSVAMKLCNFASLDPKITESGRKGLTGTSKLDRTIYAEFEQNWTGLVERAEGIWALHIESADKPETQLNESHAGFRFEPIREPRQNERWSLSE